MIVHYVDHDVDHNHDVSLCMYQLANDRITPTLTRTPPPPPHTHTHLNTHLPQPSALVPHLQQLHALERTIAAAQAHTQQHATAHSNTSAAHSNTATAAQGTALLLMRSRLLLVCMQVEQLVNEGTNQHADTSQHASQHADISQHTAHEKGANGAAQPAKPLPHDLHGKSMMVNNELPEPLTTEFDHMALALWHVLLQPLSLVNTPVNKLVNTPVNEWTAVKIKNQQLTNASAASQRGEHGQHVLSTALTTVVTATPVQHRYTAPVAALLHAACETLLSCMPGMPDVAAVTGYAMVVCFWCVFGVCYLITMYT